MIQLELITPERAVFKTDVDQVTLPTAMGEITVLPNHAPLVAALVPGVARLKNKTDEEEIAVSGGFIEILTDNVVRVLVDTAERGHELNLHTIEEARARAEKVMKEAAHMDDASFAAAAAALERELARYRVARRAHAAKGNPILDAANLPSDENPV